ncbi:hypothetical protein GCM10009414_09420 [Tatumella terrea]
MPGKKTSGELSDKNKRVNLTGVMGVFRYHNGETAPQAVNKNVTFHCRAGHDSGIDRLVIAGKTSCRRYIRTLTLTLLFVIYKLNLTIYAGY